jgi:hypothetical protein
MACARASPAPADDNGGKPAGLLGPPGQRGVTGRQEHQVVHVRAGHADGPVVIHDEQVRKHVPALRTGEVLEGQHDHQVGRGGLTLGDALGLAGREVGLAGREVRLAGEVGRTGACLQWPVVAHDTEGNSFGTFYGSACGGFASDMRRICAMSVGRVFNCRYAAKPPLYGR